MTTNYISLKSVLYDLSLVLDSTLWNESTMTEWAIRAVRKVGSSVMLQDKFALANIVDHKFQLPSDFKYINQIIYNTRSAVGHIVTDEELKRRLEMMYGVTQESSISLRTGLIINNQPQEEWLPLKAATSTFAGIDACVNLNGSGVCDGKYCEHEYSIDPTGIVTTSLKKGIVIISYKAYPTDMNNDVLIPDNESLKESIVHYLLYYYYMININKVSGGIEMQRLYVQERAFHLKQFELLKTKAAAELNEPSIDQMENIKRNRDRLVPRDNQWRSMFSHLSNREKIKYN